MAWLVTLARPAERSLRRAPDAERERITQALLLMCVDPFSGDLQKLKGKEGLYRRRVGDWRILFNLDRTAGAINITDISRRTTTTYRR